MDHLAGGRRDDGRTEQAGEMPRDPAGGCDEDDEAVGVAGRDGAVWLDENRLIQYNGDLTGRVLSIDADAWTRTELAEVVDKGSKLLNVEFDPRFVTDLIEGCYESVYIVQDACRQVCVERGVFERRDELLTLASDREAHEIIKEIVDSQSARYDSFLQGFSSGFQETALEMYRWILLPLLSLPADHVEAGIAYGQIRRIIDENHPNRPVNAGNVTQALGAAASLQVRQKITPIILDYDQSHKTLNVVDRGFLTWLGHQARADLREDLGLPRQPVSPEGLVLS